MSRNRVKASAPSLDPGPDRRRRGLLSTLWIGLLGIAFLEAFWVILEFLKPRRSEAAAETAILELGPVSRFAPGSVTAFPVGKFYLARLDDGGFLALSRRCTHLGCTLPWDPDVARFVCPCHASSFDLQGEVISPPASRALDLLEVRIENDRVKVVSDKLLRRGSFDPSQVVHPSSSRG